MGDLGPTIRPIRNTIWTQKKGGEAMNRPSPRTRKRRWSALKQVKDLWPASAE